MAVNGFEKFEERKNIARAKALNLELLEAVNEYSSVPKRDLDRRIKVLKEIIDIFDTLNLEAFDIDSKAYKNFEEELRYVEYKKRYLEEFGVEELDIDQVRKEQEKRNAEDEKNMQEYREKKRKEIQEKLNSHEEEER